MKISKLILIASVLGVFIAGGCKKDSFTSRDTSKLKPTPKDSTPPDPTLVMFDPADETTDWEISGGKGQIDNAAKKEGTACLSSVIGAGDNDGYQHFIKRRPTAVNTNQPIDQCQFVFWLYVSDVSQLRGDGQIELSSSGQSDKNEANWDFGPVAKTLKNGWNEVMLNLITSTPSNGNIDLTKVNFFRIYFWSKQPRAADYTIKVDYLRFRKRPPINVQFANCDQTDNWEMAGGTGQIDKSNKKEGAASLKATIVKTEDYMHFIFRRPDPLNPGLTRANGIFRFWFYVSDVSELKNNDGQIELTSSGQSDKAEMNWNLDQIIPNLKSGWNEMKLDLSKGNENGSDPLDLSKPNFFRIYLWAKSKPHSSDLDLRVDDFRFIEK
ncbi:hypothetical protein [Pinibacter soli]|uniref:CBM11 domain-containing protein n=1 Tax=Pinibacter soli TaxID=3044211 RepID=A0ABT6RA23_9BACT|nr:hypothetical protein [Pinibacter soli]MDI3319403.1 hypothetical protein [Pinibacter soli]